MKLVLVSPPFGENILESKGILSVTDEMLKSQGLPIAPPVLEYLAGLTRKYHPDIEIDLIDANRDRFDVETIEADILGISVLTPQSQWAYRVSDRLRERGIRVVLGGMHITVRHEEAMKHGDAVVVGEAESVWKELLNDAKAGSLKPYYRGEQLPLEGLPKPLKGLLRSNYHMGSFFTTRGCPFSCTFCSVHKFFGGTIRHRPIQDVVDEVAGAPQKMFWNVDDNIWGAGIDRSIKLYVELYRELAESAKGKYWFGSGDIATVQHSRGDELLKWASRSGLVHVMLGWESSSDDELDFLKAKSKQGRDRLDAIKRIQDHGIDIMLFMMFGGRHQKPDDYKRTLELCDRLNVFAHPTMLTPFPGTDLYEQYKAYLIPDRGWEFYNGNRAVFHHDDPRMTPEFRENALIWLRAEMFTKRRIAKRLWGLKWSGFPWTHFSSFMIQYPMGRAFREIERVDPYGDKDFFATGHSQK